MTYGQLVHVQQANSGIDISRTNCHIKQSISQPACIHTSTTM